MLIVFDIQGVVLFFVFCWLQLMMLCNIPPLSVLNTLNLFIVKVQSSSQQVWTSENLSVGLTDWLADCLSDLLTVCLSLQSEYIAPCDCRREFISGFNGSAGVSVRPPLVNVSAVEFRKLQQQVLLDAVEFPQTIKH